MKCISSIKLDERNCLPKCSGLQCSNFVKNSIGRNQEFFQNIDTFNSMHIEILRKLWEDNVPHAFPVNVKDWSKAFYKQISFNHFLLIRVFKKH